MENRTPSKWLTMIAACFGLLMLYIDLFIVNVALPTIGHDFGAPLSTVSWAISGYVLMIGVLPMGMGRLGDIWGQRRVYLVGLAIFLLASLLCGLAPNIGVLIAFRVIQGVGAAIMTPGTLSIIIRAFPPHQHGLAIGINGGISGLGLIAGPVLGGVLVQTGSWRLIFFVNVPLGLIALVLALLFVPESRAEEAVPVDWWGLLLLSTGLLSLLFSFTQAGSEGWTNPLVLGGMVLGFAILALFVVVERRVRWPLIDLALFHNRPFVMGSLSMFFFSAALFGSQPYWSLFMQNAWRFSPIQGGLAFLPATGLIAVLTPLTGLIAQRAKSRLYVWLVAGLAAAAASFLFVAATLTFQSGYVSGLLPAFIVRGFAIPVISTCVTLVVMSAVSLKLSGLASGTLGMARNIGTAFGVAILGQIYLLHVNATIPSSLAASRAPADQFLVTGSGAALQIIENAVLQSFKFTSWACAVFCVGAAIFALFVHVRARAVAVEEVLEQTEPSVSV